MITHNSYAEITWVAEDVHTLRDDLGFSKWTDSQADDFLQNNKSHIEEAMAISGWRAMEACMEFDDYDELIEPDDEA